MLSPLFTGLRIWICGFKAAKLQPFYIGLPANSNTWVNQSFTFG